MTDQTEQLLAAARAAMADKLDATEARMDAASRRVSEDLRIYTREWWGERCDEYDPECHCCRAWRIVDDFMKLNNFTD